MRRLIAVFAAIIAWAAAPAGDVQAMDRQALTHGFYHTVFGLVFASGGDAERVKRFDGPVRFYVDDRSDAGKRAAVHRFLRHLPRSVPHLSARVVDDRRRANFHVILVPSAAFRATVARELDAEALAMNARCLVGVATVGGRIVRSTAIIVSDDPFLFRRCMVEEILQGLGPMNDHPALTESVFNDSSRLDTFTRFDQALLTMLYHPAIKPGMSRREAGDILPYVLNDLGFDR